VTKLFVGNLPYKATEADLQAFFEEAGVRVDSVNILRDRFSGEARGFGVVEISDGDGTLASAGEPCGAEDSLMIAVPPYWVELGHTRSLQQAPCVASSCGAQSA